MNAYSVAQGANMGHDLRMDSVQISVAQTEPSQVSAAQVRAARALLSWSQTEAANACGVGKATFQRFEAGDVETTAESLNLLVQGFARRGVIFTTSSHGSGVIKLEVTRTDVREIEDDS